MRIRVLVPGAAFLTTAGARIRYHRIQPHLERLGHSISLQEIDSFRLQPRPDCDVVLISKCYDARGLLAAASLRAQGILVGADFFDDYYSQKADSRFVHLRSWLAAMTGQLDLALCSTPHMRENLARLAPSLACHMMNDPYEVIDAAAIAGRVEAKLKRVQSSGVLEVGWFGIGDNSYFPVGLNDLEAQAGLLAGLRRYGLSPRLSIVTNRRAMTADRLQLLARLPVPWRLEEWSEEAEQRLIERSYACVLPVNCQPFSIAKSLNRAVTALSGGAQLLSAGYPLYEVFSDFLYRDAESVAADIRAGQPRLSRATLPALAALMDRHANPVGEVAALSAFLESLTVPSGSAAATTFAVLHGRSTLANVHKFAQSNGHLSVAGFHAGASLNYDVRPAIDPATGEAVVHLSAAAMKLLRPALASQARPATTASGRACHALPLPEGLPRPAAETTSPLFETVALATYRSAMADARRLINHLFDGVRVIVAETTSPFWDGGLGNAA